MGYKNADFNYSFDFNGKETDSETGLQDYGFRIYNKSYGKFLSVDPYEKYYPYWTPYQFCGNIPIRYVDLDGKEPSEPFSDILSTLVNTALNGADNAVSILYGWVASDQSQGAHIRRHLKRAGHDVSDAISDDELGRLFNIRFQNREPYVAVNGSFLSDVADLGLSLLEFSSLIYPGKSGSGLLSVTVSPLVRANIATILRSLKISARTEDILKTFKDVAHNGKGYKRIEAEGAAIFEDITGTSLRAAKKGEVGSDFVGTSGKYLNKSIEHIGVPSSAISSGSFKLGEFIQSIDSHVAKKFDHYIVDIRNLSSLDKKKVLDHIQTNYSKNTEMFTIIQ